MSRSSDGRPEFLTVREVADVLRVSRMTIYRMVETEVLTSIRVGRSIRIPISSVHDFIENQNQNPKEELWTPSD